ncbi:TonB-dependent receptor [Acidiphilium cryptum]|nr:TonB-dependent receptor [Acidiphilium cryptum]
MQLSLMALLLSTSCLIPAAAYAQTVSAGEVSASSALSLPGVTTAPSQKKVFKSGNTTRVLNRKLLEAAGPVAGAAQMLSYAPGVQITGYGNTGASKYTVTLNGVQQGWGGFGGFTGDGAIGVTLDGVPVVDPGSDLWQSNMIPQSGMIQSVTTTYGPGNAADRWYNNLAGTIEFTPVQPTAKPGGDINLTYGSYGQKNIEFDLRTGNYHGWSTVIAGGAGDGNSFRKSPDGFQSPSNDYSIYLKTVKNFSAGNFAFGGYFARSAGYRVPVIPTSPIPGVTISGNAGAPLYSQQTSGFYSAPPYNYYEKFDTDALWMVFARENIELDDSTTLHNLTYYENFTRTHSRLYDFGSVGPQRYEYNNPYTNVIGDKLWLTEKLPFNTLNFGGYYIHTLYNSRNNFYNTVLGGNKGVVNAGGKIRSSYFNVDNFAMFLQDDIHPVRALHIIPGIRFVSFQTTYSDSALQDFAFAPGVGLSTHCVLDGSTATSGTTQATDQGSSCGSHVSRNGVEPSISANLQVMPWMALYGSYGEALRTPSVGGGGGLFQKINPTTGYQLELGQYYDIGAKFHVENGRFLHHFVAGVDYFHLRYAKQSLSTQLANGNALFASGSSIYQGVNMFADDNPLYNLYVFGNASFIDAKYQTYITGGTSYGGRHVPYVPSVNFNIGAYYDIPIGSMLLEPRMWYQYTGSQYMFNNNTGAPSNRKMPGYGTLNMSAKLTVPVTLPYVGHKSMDVSLTALNITNNQYNAYEYIGTGGYFNYSGTVPASGFTYAYPGAPFTIYGSVGFHF